MADSTALVIHSIPIVFVGSQFLLIVGRGLQNLQCLAGFRIFQQLGRNLVGVTVYLGQEAQPQHRHLTFLDGLRLKLRQFHEHKPQPLDNSVGMLNIHDGIIVVELIRTGVEAYIVDEVQGIDGL